MAVKKRKEGSVIKNSIVLGLAVSMSSFGLFGCGEGVEGTTDVEVDIANEINTQSVNYNFCHEEANFSRATYATVTAFVSCSWGSTGTSYKVYIETKNRSTGVWTHYSNGTKFVDSGEELYLWSPSVLIAPGYCYYPRVDTYVGGVRKAQDFALQATYFCT